MKTTRNIAIVYFDAASGHRSAAAALQNTVQERHPHCQVRLINITDIFDHHRLFGKIVRAGTGYFNRQLQRDRVDDLRGWVERARFCHDLVGSRGIRKIADYWKGFVPDMVVSVAPLFNPALYLSAQYVNAAVQCITIPIAFEEARSRYWFTPKVKQYYLNATDLLHQQAAKAGIRENYRFRVAGLPVEESAYELPPADRDAQLRSIGLNPAWPVGFISFGAQGSRHVLEITRALAKKHSQLNLIIMCGKNKALFRKITALKLPFPTAVYYYLPQTPLHYLHLADFAIGKPGAMTITESLITRTPLIAQKSSRMRPLQKANEEWIIKTGTGIVAATPSKVAAAVTAILSNPAYKQRIAEHQHRGIFEIAERIEQIGKLNQQQQYKSYLRVIA